MLVLSRRLNESLLFPGTQTAVKVVAIRGGVVRLGIDAPPTVRVVREELADRPTPPAQAAPVEDAGALCERLRTLCTDLGLARLQIDVGLPVDAQSTLRRVHHDVQALRQSLCGGAVKGDGTRHGSPDPAETADPRSPDPADTHIDLGLECELLAACAG